MILIRGNAFAGLSDKELEFCCKTLDLALETAECGCVTCEVPVGLECRCCKLAEFLTLFESVRMPLPLLVAVDEFVFGFVFMFKLLNDFKFSGLARLIEDFK